jgi:hypothetical protein
MNHIAFIEEKLSHVCALLAGNSRQEGAFLRFAIHEITFR